MPGQTCRRRGSARTLGRPFNGGPGNCPAKHRDAGVIWHGYEPSMEGRAIARPNQLINLMVDYELVTFNGGPGNCPAKQVREDHDGASR